MSAAETRAQAARQLLLEMGFQRGSLDVAGQDGEIAAVSVPVAEIPRLFGAEGSHLVQGLKVLGFRYVALDLSDESDEGGRE